MTGIGDILVGFSSDEAQSQFATNDRNTMLTITGVDVRPLVYRGKFVFITQIGSPQKAEFELRDASVPAGLPLEILIRGKSSEDDSYFLVKFSPKSN